MLQPSSLSSHSSSPSLQTFFQKFDLFADAPGAVAKMRDLVLNLAVKGKLSENTDGWTKSPLGEVSRLRRGYDLPKQDRKQGSVPIFAANGTVGFHETHMVKGPGVVTGRSGSIGKVHFINEDFWPLNTALYVEDFFGNYPQFISLLLRSLHLDRFSTATAVPTLNRNVVHKEIVKVPPLAEQKRIVGKVDELMALCDRLEAQQQERETRHAVLARAALARFADAPTPANLDFLFHSSFSIQPSDLRKSILTLAVQGKLVPQDPNDEPAEVFLGQIAQRLGKSKVRRSTNNGAPITDEANPFELPPGWAWSHFPELGEFGRGKSKHRPRNDRSLFIGGNHPLVQTGDVARANGTIETHTGCYNDVGLAQSKMWPAGTLCITIAANIADSGILGFDACFPDSVVGFIPAQPIQSVRYFEYFMRTAKEHLEQFAPATAQKNINLGILEQVWIPIPPLAEQRRIVAKVEQLMALVDALETQLAASRATAASLLSALVSELTAQV
jgi:type I restriction enzyme S subunit